MLRALRSKSARSVTLRRLSRFYHLHPRPAPLRLPAGCPSLLPLVISSSNLIIRPPSENPGSSYSVGTRISDGSIINKENVVPFYLSSQTSSQSKHNPIGFVRPEVSNALQKDHRRQINETSKSSWDLQYSLAGDISSIAFAPWINQGGRYSRTQHMERLIHEWKSEDIFTDILKGKNKLGHTRSRSFTYPTHRLE